MVLKDDPLKNLTPSYRPTGGVNFLSAIFKHRGRLNMHFNTSGRLGGVEKDFTEPNPTQPNQDLALGTTLDPTFFIDGRL